jgi:hypothetical protein
MLKEIWYQIDLNLQQLRRNVIMGDLEEPCDKILRGWYKKWESAYAQHFSFLLSWTAYNYSDCC